MVNLCLLNQLNSNGFASSLQQKSQKTDDHKNANNFDLPSTILNTLFNNVKKCQYLQIIDDLPVPELNKTLFFAHIIIRSIHKSFDALND